MEWAFFIQTFLFICYIYFKLDLEIFLENVLCRIKVKTSILVAVIM